MWGAWATGMAAQDASIVQRFQRLGMGTIAPHVGLTVLAQLLRSSTAQPQARIQPCGPHFACPCKTCGAVQGVFYCLCVHCNKHKSDAP